MSDDYPVIDKLPCGRRRVGMDGKGKPAKDAEHSSGWVCHPEDLPNHKKCRDCKSLPELGRTRCEKCATKNRERTKAYYEREKAKGKRWLR